MREVRPAGAGWTADRAGELRDGVCQVWWARRVPLRRRFVELLDDVERGRMSALREAADRERFVLGCVVTRSVLGAHVGSAPADVALDRTCPECGAPHGKVRLDVEDDPTQLSISHSGDLVVVALHRSAPVGVDVERVDRARDPAELYADALTRAETARMLALEPAARHDAFARTWARKEAIVKATGEGLRATLSQIEVSAADEPARLLARPDRPDLVRLTRLHDLDAGAGYAAALAVLGEDPLVQELDAARWLRP